MTKPIDTQAIEKATGQTWAQWLQFFKRIGAKDMAHHELAGKVYEHLIKLPHGPESVAAQRPGGQTSAGWWSQSITVAYEQHAGRRAPGQRSDGTYEVTVSKTLDGTMDDALNWWVTKVKGMPAFAGVALATEPDTSKTENWRYWRVNLADGSRVGVTIAPKPPGKAIFSVTSHKLAGAKDAEAWRIYWKQFLT